MWKATWSEIVEPEKEEEHLCRGRLPNAVHWGTKGEKGMPACMGYQSSQKLTCVKR